jgi:hypothetical protein
VYTPPTTVFFLQQHAYYRTMIFKFDNASCFLDWDQITKTVVGKAFSFIFICVLLKLVFAVKNKKNSLSER